MNASDLMNFIQAEMIIIIPVLIVIGATLKKMHWINDWAIPIVLGVIGATLAICLLIIQDGLNLDTIVKGFIQGILCSGMAVYIHQLKIQTTEKRIEDQKHNLDQFKM